MRGDHRQLQLGRQLHGPLHVGIGAGMAGTLQFDIEALREHRCPVLRGTARALGIAVGQRHADIAAHRTGQRDQAGGERHVVFARLQEPRRIDLRAATVLVAQPRARQQHAQVQVAAPVLHQQQQARGLVAVFGIGQPDIGPDHRLHALAARFLVIADQPEGVGKVRQRECAHAIGGSGLDGVIEADDAVHDGVFGMQAEVDEAGCGHGRHCTGSARLPASNIACRRCVPAAAQS
ncbi:hypothetical protein D9M72_393170 [compost metagenome]